jgi:transposase
MRFEEAYGGWQAKRLTQEEAALMLGVSDRSFRRFVVRYEAEGLAGLLDQRIEQVSKRCAPVDEVMRLVEVYRSRYEGWNVAHFHGWYQREHQGTRSYTWVKDRLQQAGAVERASTAANARGGRYRGCCYTKTAANSNGCHKCAGT